MKMQAVVMKTPGGAEVLQLIDVDAPQITKPHEVLVRVRAAGVNPADYQARRRPFAEQIAKQTGSWPILGLDGAGIVEAVGEAVTRFAVGDEVYYVDGAIGQEQGNYAQYKVVDEHYLARKPASVDFLTAAAFPTVLVTAWEALYDRARLKAGDFVLIHGGAGGVGHIAIQLAVERKARVAATVSTPAKAAIAQSLGAERTIRYRDEDVAAAVRAWTGKEGADVVFDTIGKANFANSFGLVAAYGTLVNTAVGDWPHGNNLMGMLNNIHIVLLSMGLPQSSGDHAARIRQTQMLEDGAKLIDAGKLRVVLGGVYPLAKAGEAQRALEAGEITGRVVLDIQ